MRQILDFRIHETLETLLRQTGRDSKTPGALGKKRGGPKGGVPSLEATRQMIERALKGDSAAIQQINAFVSDHAESGAFWTQVDQLPFIREQIEPLIISKPAAAQSGHFYSETVDC